MLGSAYHNNRDMKLPKFRIRQTLSGLKLSLSSFISIANQNNAGYSVIASYYFSYLDLLEVQYVRVNKKLK